MIPNQLKKEGFRFIKVKSNKAPFEKDWQNTMNYSWQDLQIHNNMYGVVCGYNNLIVIDFDNEIIQDEIVPKLPKTFTIKTAGKGLLHKYFITDNPEGFRILDINKNTLADVQGKGTQVIGAGSILDNGRKYEIVDDSEIAKISIVKIKEVFSPYMNIEEKIKNKEETDEDCKKIKEKIKVKDLLFDWDIDITSSNTQCPFHDSRGGKCFSYKEDMWHCFHCDRSGNIFHLLMEKEQIDFIDAKKALADKVGIKLTNNFKKAMRKFEIDYLEVAEEFWKVQPFFYDKAQLWWLWNFNLKCYERIDDTDLMNKINESMPDLTKTTNSRVRTEIIESLKRVGRLHIPLDAPDKWVQFKDKAYSINSKKIYDVQPNYFFTNPIPWELSENSETPVLDVLFEQWVGKEYVKTLYEIIAYCCLRSYPIHLVFCLIGSGRNGKSCFQRVLSKFIGMENICSTELDDLLESRFEKAKLFKKLVCSLGETNFNIISKTSIIKKLSGQDLIGFEFKNKDPFDDYSYAKIIINSNSLPGTEDTSEGWYRRWMIIDFPNEFPEGNDIVKSVPDSEYMALARKCCKILPDLLKRHNFTNQGTIEERKQHYIMASNPLPIFLKECCEIGNPLDYFVGYNKLYKEYVGYLQKNKRRRVSRKEFSEMLLTEGFFSNRTSKKVGVDEYEKNTWIEGLRLKFDKISILDKDSNSDLYIEEVVEKVCPKWTKLKSFIKDHPKDNAIILEDLFGKEQILKWQEKGDISEIKPGTFIIIE